MTDNLPGVRLRCPVCDADAGPLGESDESSSEPCRCGFVLRWHQGILRAMSGERREYYARFLCDYVRIRRAEGRGSPDSDFYHALPYQDLSGKHSEQWAIRGRSYRYFESAILPGLARGKALDILDLGAGNGWMSYRLSSRRHRPVAVDIVTDTLDGLAAARIHFHEAAGVRFPLVEAEYDRLPFVGGEFDLAIFNSSFHYSVDYRSTLAEARRCLRPGGNIVVLDSPVYRRAQDGERMREEKHRTFAACYGLRSDSLPSQEYLDVPGLRKLGHALHLSWKIYRPWYGWKWFARPLRARLKSERPPSRFWILVGSFAQS